MFRSNVPALFPELVNDIFLAIEPRRFPSTDDVETELLSGLSDSGRGGAGVFGGGLRGADLCCSVCLLPSGLICGGVCCCGGGCCGRGGWGCPTDPGLC